MCVILWPDPDCGVHVVGPFADEDAAQEALDRFFADHDEADQESYDIVLIEPKLELP